MNIVLIGYRGTGKSAAGNLVGTELDMPVLGMDSEIVRRAGAPVPEIVEKHGWTWFRDLESEVARDFSSKDGVVIDCGGGVIERPQNMAVLKKNASIFWLKASVPLIVKRIGGDTQRPSLTGKSFTDEVAEVLERRTPLYNAYADYVIDTDAHTPADTAREIVQIWNDMEG